MHKNNRTVWTEGMFLGPQHFQQHDRFLLNTIAAINKGTHGFPYGLINYELDANALSEGKVALANVSGIFANGTPFSLPTDDDLPEPLEISPDIRNQIISLAIPYSNSTNKDITESKTRDSFSRYLLKDQNVADRHSLDSESEETVFTAGLWTRLVLDDSEQTAYHTIPLLRVSERREDGSVLLDKEFYCCAMSLQASPPLVSMCREIHGLLSQRATELAGRLGTPNASDTSQLTQFLLLQIINRAEPLLRHIANTAADHPEQLYRDCLQLAGELSTITTNSRTAPEFSEYLHHDQYQSFLPVFNSLRESLNWIPDSTTESIPVKHVKAGIYTSSVKDLHLFESARFILAAKARITPDELARRFPRQTTISSKAKLRDLVEAQSQGVELKSLVTVPNSIPMYESYVYFELRQDNPLWQEIAVSGDIAMHVAGSYADLQMQLWTIQK